MRKPNSEEQFLFWCVTNLNSQNFLPDFENLFLKHTSFFVCTRTTDIKNILKTLTINFLLIKLTQFETRYCQLHWPELYNVDRLKITANFLGAIYETLSELLTESHQKISHLSYALFYYKFADNSAAVCDIETLLFQPQPQSREQPTIHATYTRYTEQNMTQFFKREKPPAAIETKKFIHNPYVPTFKSDV